MVRVATRITPPARTLLCFGASNRSLPHLSVGPDWRDALDHAVDFVNRMSKVPSLGRPLAVTDDSVVLSRMSQAGIEAIRSSHLARLSGPNRSGDVATGTGSPLLILNPFFVHLDSTDLAMAMDLFHRSGDPVCSVRTPAHHPILFREWKRNRRLGRYMEKITCDAWSSDSFFLYVDGRPFEMRRQNYPEVVQWANALMVATSEQLKRCSFWLRSGRFTPYELDGLKRFDYSHRMERIRAQSQQAREKP